MRVSTLTTPLLKPVAAVLAVIALVMSAVGPAAAVDYSRTGQEFAAYNYDWNPLQWKFTYTEASFPSAWHHSGAGRLGQKNGMLVLRNASSRTASATLSGHPDENGRWELRLTSMRGARAYSNYQVVVELIPARPKAGYCGDRDIRFGAYRTGEPRTTLTIHGRPDYLAKQSIAVNHDDWYWHTYGVQVTANHITWYVDGNPIVTDRNDAALSGIDYTVRLSLIPRAGRRMNPTRLLVDTIRHFGMDRGRLGLTTAEPNRSTVRPC